MLLRNVPKCLLFRLHLRKCHPQASSVIVRGFSGEVAAASIRSKGADQQPAHYREPEFFRHFPTFLTENSLRRHLPSELWFQYSQALEELEELAEIVQQSSSKSSSNGADDTDGDNDFFEL